MSDLERMKELVEQLDAAARAYYQESKELMSNKEYDELYDELAALEKKTGTVLAKSPTAHAGYEVLSALPKENHPSPMLSLDKTKEVSQLQEFLNDQTGVLSWKLDGLTIVLTYENGTLTKAVTRGNGITGEVVTQNARQFENLPTQISLRDVWCCEVKLSFPIRILNESMRKILMQMQSIKIRETCVQVLCAS